MESGAILILIATAIGVLAGIIQVVDYFQKRMEKSREEKKNGIPLPISKVEILHNLPPRNEFIGRKEEKSRLHQALRSRFNIICVEGMGGIGKSSLALEVAHECLQISLSEVSEIDQRFQGFIWVSAKTVELNLDLLLSQIARVLDFPSIVGNELQLKQVAIRRLLSKSPYLIIIDNFETAHDENIKSFLLDLPEPSKALITSRDQILESAWSLSLTGLSQEESFTLIRQEGIRLNLKSVKDADAATCLKLHNTTGGAPLAIKWAIGQIKQKGETLDGVLGMLYNAKGDIYELIFSKSWNYLAAHSQQVIITLAILPSSASKQCVSTGANIHDSYLDEALGQLIELSLVEVTDNLDLNNRRYSIHQLTRFFANSKLIEFSDLENLILNRILIYYQNYTKEILKAGWIGYSRLAEERDNLLKIIKWGYIAAWNQTKDLALEIKWLLWENGYWYEILSLYNEGFAVAKETRDVVYMGRYAKEIAWVKCRQGDIKEALSWSNKVSQYWNKVSVQTLDLADLNSLIGVVHPLNWTPGKNKLDCVHEGVQYATDKTEFQR
jgi:NB-ARC domain-containing protein